MQVSKLDLLNELEQSGHLKLLIAYGILPYTIIMHRDVYKYVQYQISSGLKKKQAVEQAEIEFGIVRSTVYECLKRFAD